MNIVVVVNLVPDLVEELTIAEDEARLDMEWLSLILNEFDDHAIEQAILLKERGGGHVTVLAPDIEGADEVLYASLAKGADQVAKVAGDTGAVLDKHALAAAFAAAMPDLQPDLILTGVQAHDDLDGSLGSLLAAYLHMPYVGYIAGVQVSDGTAQARKEYPGGLVAEIGVQLPAVIGIQAAEKPPRYVAFSKVRQVMQSADIAELDVETPEMVAGVQVKRMYESESGKHATMIEGDEEAIAARLVAIFDEIGIM